MYLLSLILISLIYLKRLSAPCRTVLTIFQFYPSWSTDCTFIISCRLPCKSHRSNRRLPACFHPALPVRLPACPILYRRVVANLRQMCCKRRRCQQYPVLPGLRGIRLVRTVPASMLRDKHLVVIYSRKCVGSVKSHTQCRYMRPQYLYR